MASRAGAKEYAPVGCTLLVIHNFAARSNDELSLAKGDRLELIERDDDFGDGWFLGRHLGTGRSGLFPEVYTTVAPKPTLSSAAQHQRSPTKESFTNRAPIGIATTTPSSPTQYRHVSESAATARPASATGAQQASSPTAPKPILRTSLPNTTAGTRSASENIPTASPVMHETLSVINEHMNDMHGQRGSSSAHKRHSTGPGYTFISGQETDEEENAMHTEAEVMAWSPQRVAEYLEDHGVEKQHCDVFLEQEITGEVLLAMEQSSLFLKEFSLGSVGRRLKTWHKIRALQDEVRQVKSPEPQSSPLEYSGEDAAATDAARDRASTVGSALPRALDTSRQSTVGPARSSTLPTSLTDSTSTAISLQETERPSGPQRTWSPSAQDIREMQAQKRMSQRQSSLERDSVAGVVNPPSSEIRRKQPSFDRTWQPGQPQANGQASAHRHALSADTTYPATSKRDSSIPSIPGQDEQDRGYFSSTEVDNRSRNVVTPATSKTSADIGGSELSRSSSFGKRRSTLSSGFTSPEPVRDSMSPTTSRGIFGALNSVGNSIGSFRSATSPTLRQQQQDKRSPVVTKLDHSGSAEALTDEKGAAGTHDSNRSAVSPRTGFLATYKPKLAGLRTISDAITRGDKSTAAPSKDREIDSPVPTGSSTPSTERKSSEFNKSEINSRTSAGSGANLVPPTPASQRRIRVKPKKATSAYTRGLEHKSPAEQMIGSDYSGWMKKKSGSLMTTWKTRLFVLRGRRLSYYYSDNDTEEKGLIDISFHRVLPATNETLTGLHATVTGVAASPSSPKDSITQTAAELDLAAHPAVGEDNEGVFIFKLVPPKSGLSKGVNFTKPTVHYFAVNSRQEGRLWMAALMKATIDRDEDGVVTTTYNQKTISLAKARARRERPPALMESDGEKERAELEANGDEEGGGDDDSAKGLGILDGLGGNYHALADSENLDLSLDPNPTADRILPEDASSLAPSTLAPSTVMTGLDSVAVSEKPAESVPAPATTTA